MEFTVKDVREYTLQNILKNDEKLEDEFGIVTEEIYKAAKMGRLYLTLFRKDFENFDDLCKVLYLKGFKVEPVILVGARVSW